jgi:hypothetical protein
MSSGLHFPSDNDWLKDGHMTQEAQRSQTKSILWAGGLAHLMECLLSKHEALSSNSSHAKRKKKSQFLGFLASED